MYLLIIKKNFKGKSFYFLILITAMVVTCNTQETNCMPNPFYKLAQDLIMEEAAYQQYHTVYPKKYAHSFFFAVLCCGYTLTDFPISIRLTSLALWQSNDCPSASKTTQMDMDKYFMWIHYERLQNHNKAKHNKTVCIFLGIYCIWHIEGETKWLPFHKLHCQMHFHEWKVLYFYLNVTDICS